MSSSMDEPTTPTNPEDERLRTLRQYEILDSPEEPHFDTLTQLGTQIFEIPICLICLVDENRLWFKSVQGLDRREVKRQSDIDDNILLSPGTVTIENTRIDERVPDGRFLEIDPDIRSYAGAPLRADNDQIIGTFCILDRTTRSYTVRDRTLLETLAHATMEQIHLRYHTETRREINDKLRVSLNQYRNQLQQSQVEKNELLHRVKNNFSQVRSLLNQERSRLGESVDIDALESAEAKIHCFVAVYEQLDQARYSESISSRSYLSEITDNASRVFENEVEDISVTVNFEDRRVPSELILKFGIALNEFITNSYQHVFIPKEGEQLEVSFESNSDRFLLTVSDNGPGLPDDIMADPSKSGGLHLIRTMIGFEEGGTFEYEFTGRSTFTVELPVPQRDSSTS